jgi:hypothetical protein
MINRSPLDIFRIERSGVLWVGSAATLQDAKARIRQFTARDSGEYLVLDQLTGDRFVLNADLASAERSR